MRFIMLLFIFLGLCLACNDNAQKPSTAEQQQSGKKDSALVAGTKSGKERYVEKAHLETGNYSISFTSRYTYPPGIQIKNDSEEYFRGFYVIGFDKNKKKSDTVEVTAEYDSPCIIRDLTDSLKLSSPLFQVVTPADDGYYSNDFVRYENAVLKSAVWIEDYDSTGIHLKRKDDHTLSGIIIERDELFFAYENNFPISIDLNTFYITRNLPDTQYIGFHTIATKAFKAHVIINGRLDDQLKGVEVGDSLIIDTLYRNLKKVRLHTTDSTEMEIKVETADKKIQKLMVG